MSDLLDRIAGLTPEKRALLARRLQGREGGNRPARGISPGQGSGPLSLSFAQERLWFLDRLAPGSPAYNMSAAFGIEGALDVPTLQRSLNEIVRRHAVLRTTFAEREGRVFQVIVPEAALPLPVVDLSGLPAADRRAGAELLLQEESRRPYDLEAGPLVRALLLRRSSGEHTFLIGLHHISGDGWSLAILMREAVGLYTAFSRGRPSPLPELPVAYADFAAWQRGRLQGEALTVEIAHWRTALAGAPALLELPADRPRPPVQSFRGASERIAWPAPLRDALAARARREGVTLFMLLLAGFDALLYRLTGRRDVLVGSPVANRDEAELEGLIGLFVNTLVLRACPAGGLTFQGLVRQVQAAALAAYAHQDLPFERLVSELQVERNLSYNPLFQVLFALQNAPLERLEAPGLRLSLLPLGAVAARVDLAIAVWEEPEGLRGVAEHALDLFDAATVRRLISAFGEILAGAVADPGLRLSDLPLLTGAERRQLAAWGGEPAEPPAVSVTRGFEEQARRTPDDVAVACGEESVTYAELYHRASLLALHLRGLGVGPEVCVGLSAGRNPWLVAGLLGIWKAGGAFVPLDPALPEARLAFMIEDAGLRAVLAEPDLLDRLPVSGVAAVRLPPEVSRSSTTSGTEIPEGRAGDLAYLIYTSGTTGRPKAVAVEQGHLAHTLAACRRTFDFRAGDRMPCIAPFSFDIFLFELLNPLLAGGIVDLFELRPALDIEAVTAALARSTHFHAVPAVMRQVVDRARACPPPGALAGLRELFVGGDAVPAELLADLREVFPQAEVHVLYGPTEATIICSAHRVPACDSRALLGRPLPGSVLHLLDGDGNVVPVGVPGEIWIGGGGVSRGYLARPDLTAEKLVPAEGGGRWYRTGDLARRLDGGVLEFLGRIDHQVKIRGFRVELGEIEARLASHPAVAAVAVLVSSDHGDRSLRACVVPEAEPRDARDRSELIAGLRRALAETLPAYMIPTSWLVLETLPLTPHGKVDRQALAAAAGEPGDAGEDRSPALLGPTEQMLASVWSDLLGIERILAGGNFFHLGGHSLLATRLVSRLRDVFGVELPLRTVFEEPTLAGLAARIEAEARLGALPPPVARASRDSGAPLPLSFAQERLWFLDRLAPGSPAYNMPFALRAAGSLGVGALAGALDAVERRHGSLRTAFVEVDGAPVQVVSRPAGIPLPLVDLEGLPGGLREPEARRLVAAEALLPFDLTRRPLLRATVLRLGAEEHMVLLTLHHIVSDGWSVGVLVQELGALYAAALQGHPSPLAGLPVQYTDYALWQRDWLRGPVLAAQLLWWRDELAGAPALLELPADRRRPAVQSYRGAAVPVALPAGLARGLAALARDEGATLFMVLAAGFQTLLYRWAGQPDDVLLATAVAQRTRIEVESLIGFFVNTLVLRGRTGGDPGFRTLLARTRQSALGAFTHQDLPFERLIDEVQIERSLRHNPLAQVMLVVQNAPWTKLELPGLTLHPVEPTGASAKFDLSLALAETEDGIEGSLEYSTDLFEAPTVHRLLEQLRVLLEGIVAAPDEHLSALPLLTAGERGQLLSWNATDVPWSSEACLHELVAAQARRIPEAPAVLFAGETLTRGELAARSIRLAHRLRSLGVGPESLVGLCLERSPELPVGLLGILQAGGAWVPLEPGWPDERLAAMAGDARLEIVVTDGRLAGRLRSSLGEACRLVDVAEGGVPPETALPRAEPEHAAYCIFTSGSTGRPKGAINTHRAIVNRLLWGQGIFVLGPHDRVLQKTPLSFDVSVWEMFWPLISGACLVLARPDEHRDPSALAETLAGREITTVHFVPSMLQAFLETGGQGPWPSLRRVLCSGEALSAELARRALAQLGPVELHNLYGPTEAAVEVSHHACRPGEATVPIGRPVANTRLHVLDRQGHLAPVGSAGELCLGGVQVARGYVGRPELTAERFVPDPSGPAGARMYRTGDLARWLSSGEVEYLGRIDHQVKVRGVRIELGEIESALLAVPGVGAAAVLARGEGTERSLVAWLTIVPGEEAPSVETIRAALRRRLPDSMVPAEIAVLDSLPLLPAGKVDRRALGMLAPERVSRASYVAPQSSTEVALARLWSGLLGRERIGLGESFFELGGHSLLAARLVARVREALGVELPLRAVFEAATVEGLARWIDQAIGKGDAPAAPPLRRVPRGGLLPLSFAQERLWFLDQLEPGSPAYNLPAPLRLAGDLDVAVLARSLREIVRRHEALRTAFRQVDGVPRQVISPAADPDLPVVDLRALPAAVRELEAIRLAREEAGQPFDLAHGPLLRARLLRQGEREWTALLSLHHIAGDGWSLGVLVRELSALYAAFLAGEPSPLAALPVQYADYAVWQRQWLQGEVLGSQLSWWRDELAGAPAQLELPADRPRPAVQSSRGAAVSVRLGRELTRALSGLSKGMGASLFMTLLAGFQSLLHRLSGQEDLVVGSPIAGRRRTEIEGLIGFFVNTLPLRARLVSGDGRSITFRELLGTVRAAALGSYTHQDLPFERVVEELRVERSLAHHPVFQAVFSFQNAPTGTLDLPGLVLTPLDPGSAPAKFDLTLALEEGPEGLDGTMEYAVDLFDTTTIRRWAGSLHTLLMAAVSAPDHRVADLELLTAAERHQLLVEWNDERTDYPAQSCVHELFAAQVEITPDAAAVSQGPETLTWAGLDRRANRLANHLLDLGAGAGTPVAVCLERSLDMVVATLAVLKAGGAYVPLDISYPPDRLAFMVEDVGAPVVLTRERWLGLFTGSRVVCLDRDAARLAEASSRPPVPGAVPSGPAYVIYTSGSTGRPKGVAVPHRAIVRLVRSTNYVALGPDDVVAQVASTSFDAATFELWGALLNGGRLAVVPQEAVLEPGALAAAFLELGITASFLTAALFHQMVREAPNAFAGVRFLLAGGEALDPGRCRELLGAAAPPRRLINGYGPTESTTFAACHHIASVPAGAASVPIGRPISNTSLFVLDREMRPAPIGVVGELFIGGDGLALGYAGRPELTAERFVPAPAGGSGGRLYRTGDLVRRLSGGEVDFLGRRDGQVKIRGFRIELGEIEGALAAHPAVSEAAVLAREDRPGDKRLIAYVGVRAEERQEDLADVLRSGLAARLPAYMIPPVFVVLDALPLTPNGKVDRRALAGIAPERALPESFAAPQTPTEIELARIWSQLLGEERIGLDEDFFGLGGHSLMATRMVSQVRRAFGVDLPLRAVFEMPTVEGLARWIDHALGEEAGPAAPPLRPVPREGALPLSFAQERLWLLDRLDPGGSAYNMPVPFHLQGDLDVAVLARSLREIVRRHEALRTVFPEMDGAPRQVVSSGIRLDVPVVDLRELPEVARETEGARLSREETARPFDLARGPLLRAGLLQLGDREWTALLTLHHIVGDGWSFGVLVRELSALYPAFLAGQLSPLPELPLQYADYAVWQRRWLQGEVLEARLSWWRSELAGAVTLLELPADRPRPAVQSYRGAAVPVALPAELARGLGALAREAGATLFMVLAAGFQALLYRWAGQPDDILLATAVAHRTRVEVEDLIGFFVNTLVLRGRTGDAPAFRELVDRARRSSLGAFAHQDLPFERLVEEAGVERSLSHNPLAQVMLVLQNTPAGALELPGLTLRPADPAGASAKLDLSLSLAETEEGGIEGSLEYATDLFEAPTIQRLAGQLRMLLEGALATPEARLSDLPLLAASERHQLLAEWNDTGVATGAACLHELFERQAARTPDAVALVAGEESILYRELDERAGELARRLRALGVGPEARVAIHLRRSPEMVVALLAVLKAGGAYVPIDPSYPRPRVDAILEDARPVAVLTEEGLRAELPAPDLPRRAADPDHLAYVIFTSGSTGRPKGVAITHRSAAVLLAWAREVFPVEDLGRVLFATSICFDLSVFELFLPLSCGGAVVLAENALELPDLPAAGEVTLVNTVPSALAELVASRGLPPSVRTVNLAGEPLRGALVRRIYEIPTVRRVLNLYGPSEATTYSTFAALERESSREPAIGRPVAGTQVWLLDHHGRPVPAGAAGELMLSGAGLARGYLGRPDLTAERFLPNPFTERPGDRLYRTGDLARYRADGGLEYLGRLDHQVKIRGFRIELGEIEAALVSLPDIREAVVLACEDGTGGKRLVAWVGAVPLSAGDLRDALAQRLPGYMVPSAIVVLDALPRTPNGKVDRKALPSSDLAGASGRPFQPPRDTLELELVRIWEDVLHRRLGITDSFFDLGGHSLLAVQLLARIEQRFGRRLPLAGLFAAPMVERQAEQLRGTGEGETFRALVPLATRGEKPPFFCVHAVDGGVFAYLELARRLDRPFYGLQAPPPDGRVTVESLAALYLEEVRQRQPHGPFFLGGWSMGAAVAFEMAQALRGVGEEVALLALLEPSFVRPPEEPSGLSPESLFDGFVQDLAIQGQPELAEQAAGPLGRALFATFRANLQALQAWRPSPYDGPAHLFVAGASADTRGWEEIVRGGLSLSLLPGDHYSFLRDPHLPHLVERLHAILCR